MTTGERLRRWRRANRWTGRAFAGLVGCDPATLYRWEEGHARPDAEHRIQIERATGIPVAAWSEGRP